MAFTLARTYGWRGLALRSAHEVRRRLDLYRAAPRVDIQVGGASLRAFCADRDALARSPHLSAGLERARRVRGGEYHAYRSVWRRLPASPGAWHRHPTTGELVPQDRPWWRLDTAECPAGDIKDLWEPGRFAWAYDLMRGFLLTGDDAYAEAFYRAFESWCADNPPFRGAQWADGQETAIRAVALLHAEANFATSPATTPERRAALGRVLTWSGERIRDALGYAVSQRNNHGISEATGLLCLGLRLRSCHPDAERWLALGRRILERLVREQFAADGWYIQHSLNYMRLALDQCVVAQLALRTIGASLAPDVIDRLRAASELLGLVVDPATGVAPNHGPNDGALSRPVSAADFCDYRPVLTSVAAVFGFELPEDMDVDREVLSWTGPAGVIRRRPRQTGVAWGQHSGWVVVRVGGVVVFTRAARYRTRPGHADPMHVDVRRGSEELIVDAGTFAYAGPPPWNDGLSSSDVHNGPVLNDRPHGERGPRFLWLRWPTAQVLEAASVGTGAIVVMAIPGVARRTVRVSEEAVHVTDCLLARAGGTLRTRWLLHPSADPRRVTGSGRRTIIAASEAGVLGWFSPRYGQRFPSCVVEFTGSGGQGFELQTRLALA